jgi:endonuclease/exonuclease/phosphatase family metal-dependent hydrolase
MILGTGLEQLGAAARTLLRGTRAAGSAMTDAIGVVRTITPKAVLELDPALAGKLDMPIAAGRPIVALHARADGLKVMTVNIHMGTPSQVGLSDVGNESIDAMRGVAAHVNRENPDLVFVQEVRHRPSGQGLRGVPDQPSVFAHLIGADDMAFTPAVARIEGAHEGYGTAIYARNGAQLGQVHNARLTNWEPGIEERSAGVAEVTLPDGTRLTAIGTHLDHNRPVGDTHDDFLLRAQQLHDIGGMVDAIRATGSVTYHDVRTGASHLAAGMPSQRFVVAGDFNQQQGVTDQVLHEYGLTHTTDLLRATGTAAATARAVAATQPTSEWNGMLHRIDHIYASGFDVADAGLVKSGTSLWDGPTDHHFPTAALRAAQAGASARPAAII